MVRGWKGEVRPKVGGVVEIKFRFMGNMDEVKFSVKDGK